MNKCLFKKLYTINRKHLIFKIYSDFQISSQLLDQRD